MFDKNKKEGDKYFSNKRKQVAVVIIIDFFNSKGRKFIKIQNIQFLSL